MEWKSLYQWHQANLDDFWGRRETNPQFQKQVVVFGWPVQITSNHKEVLKALKYSLPLFSNVPLQDQTPFEVQFAVRTGRNTFGEPPTDLMNHITYTGDGSWLMIHLGIWGHAHVDLCRGKAIIVLTTELAQRPDIVGRCVLNTVLLNLCIGSGMGMLHTSCLIRDEKALLLLAPHNSGKSTTSLHLVLEGGYRLVTDSMIYILPGGRKPLLAGFPVGLGKLRQDMLDRFPQIAPLLRPEQVRDETKFVIDLHDLDPELVETKAIAPEAIELCLLSRNGREYTNISPVDVDTVWAAIAENSLFFDNEDVWERNLSQIARVVKQARTHYLTIGNDSAGIIRAINTLWST